MTIDCDATVPDVRERAPFQNYGMNIHVPTIERIIRPTNGTGGNWLDGLARVRAVVREAEAARERLLTIGSAWSFSDVLRPDDWVLETQCLNAPIAWQSGDLLAAADNGSLFHVQAGMRVDALNALLESHDRSLPTIGGNAGQTIGGVTATGSHGSHFRLGGLADAVVALCVVAEGGTAYWVEAPGRPVATDAFLSRNDLKRIPTTQAEPVAAASVALGAMGVVHSLVVATVPKFYLELERKKISFDDAALQNALRYFDLSGFADDTRIRHFEAVVSPHYLHEAGLECCVTIAREVPTTSTVIRDPNGCTIPDPDQLAALVRALASTNPNDIPFWTQLLMGAVYGDRHVCGPLSVLSPRTVTENIPTMSAEVAFPRGSFEFAWSLIQDHVEAAKVQPGGPYFVPGPVGFRFTKRSRATLGFTRFPNTCTAEFALMGRVGGTEPFLLGLMQYLRESGLTFAQHPGQFNDYDESRFRDSMGAARIKGWKEVRRAMNPSGLATFATQFARRVRLV